MPDPFPPADPVSDLGPALRRDAVDDIAVLLLSAPQGNDLDAVQIAALAGALDAALADPRVSAVVIGTSSPSFCLGPADDLPPPSPEAASVPPALAALAALCTRIAGARKPVVAALQGRVASAGVALAAACAAASAGSDTVLSLPETRLARLPPGNAAVRLAWRIGAPKALALAMGTGMSADEAQRAGLVARLGPPLATALALARELSPGFVPSELRPALGDPAAFSAALARARAALPAPLPETRRVEAALIDCIEAAQLLPPEQALAFDLALAEDAVRAPAARAAAHLARARRRLATLPDRRPQAPVQAALAPAQAALLVPALLRAGLAVSLHAPDRDHLAARLEAVAQAQLDAVNAGRASAQAMDEDWSRLAGHLGPAQGSGPYLADEAHAGWLDGALGQGLLWSDPLPGVAPPAGVFVARPAPTRPAVLCEVIEPATATEAQRATMLALVRALAPVALPVRGASALAALVRASARAAARLRAAGIRTEALVQAGVLPAALAEGPVAPEPEALPLPAARLMLLALVREGLRLVEAGQVRRPSDVDLALVLGAGWPAARGGPMAEAAALGPLVLRHELAQAQRLDATIWAPSPLLDALLHEGRRLSDLDR